VQAAIEARAVTFRRRAGEVMVRDISLTVGRAELVAIIGGSGSGKTTLLDALSGLRPPTSGEVLRNEPRQLGYVPRGDSVSSVLPLVRALRYTAVLRGVYRPGNAVEDVLGLVGLANEASLPVGQLNPGARKRAAIAAELLPGPADLFLDEATTGLDQAQATEVLRLLRRLSDTGVTVLLTTSSPLEAARCDKVAVLATGGHLAFYGTPAAACGYFGADSLEEIYERLAGLGDPAAAWSRRFFYFSRTTSGSTPAPTTPGSPGPAFLVPDLAGPHSAGRPSLPFADDLDPGDWSIPGPRNGSSPAPEHGSDLASDHEGSDHEGSGDWGGPDVGYGSGLDAEFGRDLGTGAEPDPGAGDGTDRGPDLELDAFPSVAGASHPEWRHGARSAGSIGPARQLPVLIRRNAEILGCARRQQAIVAGTLAAVLLAFCVLLGVGALNGPAAVTLAWAVLGGLVTGLASQLPARAAESGVLRRERFAGLSPRAFIAAKAIVLLPVLAAADALILAVPALADRLQAGFGMSYLAVLAASVIGLAAATATLFRWNGHLTPLSLGRPAVQRRPKRTRARRAQRG
jgi:ABC-type multidrug transport system ATPase subunit